MNKKVKVVLIILLCLLVIGGIVFASITIINKAEKDKKELEKKEKEVIDNFDSFKEAIGGFNIEWSTYHSIIESDINVNTIYQYDGWILSLDSYTKAIDKVEETAKTLKKNCVNEYYANTNVKNKCAAFIDAYEKAINTYVQDIDNFNIKIDEINEKKKESLEKYESKYKMIDLNKDNTFATVEVKEESKDKE